MPKTDVAIYANGKSPNASAELFALKNRVINDGWDLAAQPLIYKDIESLLADAKTHRFKVLYLSSIFMTDDEEKLIRRAVCEIYTRGLSAIACDLP